jgi:protein-tyrosine-phosphatase
VPDAIAGASRFAAARLVYPHPARDPDRFVEWLEQELRTGAYRLVMPVTDLTVIPISRELSRLQAYCPIATERFDTIQLVSDKSRTLALAARVGVPVPATIAVHREDEIDGCAARLTYPVVCKPMASSVWTPAGYLSPSVFYALDEQAFRRLLPPRVRECPFLVQEFRGGVGVGVEVLARNGEILQAFQHQRLHELPLTGGASTYRMSVPVDARLREYTRRLLAEIGWTGVAMVEFKVDLTTHEAVLMEINGRFWGSLPLSSRAGMSFAKDLHDMLTTGSTPPERRYATGVRCRKLRDDLEWFKESAKLQARDPLVAAGIIRKPSARTWLSGLLRLASPAEHYDAQTLSDPIPGLIDLRATVVTQVASIRRHLAKAVRHIGSRFYRMRYTSRLLARAASAERVVFLCYGNIMRSAFASAYYSSRSHGQALSAGFHQRDSRPADPRAVAAARTWGLDLSSHRSRTIDRELMSRADLVLVMDHANLAALAARYPDALEKTYLLGSLDAEPDVEIADPFEAEDAATEKACGRIASAIDRLLVHASSGSPS